MLCSSYPLPRTLSVTIPDGGSLSGPIYFNQLSAMTIYVPAGFGNDIGFQHSDSVNGVYTPVYDDQGALLEITPSGEGWYTAPSSLTSLNFIRLWSQNGGVSANVTSDTQFIVVASATAAGAGIVGLPLNAGIVAVVAGRDLATTDAGKILEASGTFALNCPNGLDVGFQCAIAPISGVVTLTATTTLQYWSAGPLVTAAGAVTLNAMVSVYHAGSNIWRVAGDVSE